MPGKQENIKRLLNKRYEQYNHVSFIDTDPISLPRRFTHQPDIEIAGFFAAIFAWGNRTTIINKTSELLQLMNNQPHQFVLHYSAGDIARLTGFKHRTFCFDDLLYFIEFFHRHYREQPSLETAFTQFMQPADITVEGALNGFRRYFFAEEHARRTEKHIASPELNSACKRLNMFLRWMVRTDRRGVDFGIWKNIKPAQLVCPLDVHVAKNARALGLLQRKQNDWAAALELTAALRRFDERDPVKYDFALFGMGVFEKGV
ncbi:MAG: TIGR02757 family protein [Dinghuibacter sp.]|nr:TIGR02757 family protein [Dinghuibacter sp.]